ncbi:thioesterase II family protein (plasmid) [Exiguobacterium acetylicum]
MLSKRSSEQVLTDIQLIAIPFAGGSLNSYSQMKLIDGVTIINYELPGRGRRYEDSEYTMEKVKKEIIKHIDFTKPYILFGHSMGAFIAYETCVLIEELNLNRPYKVILSAQIPPHCVDDQSYDREMDNASVVAYLRSMGGTPQEVLDSKELIDYYGKILKNDLTLLRKYLHNGWSPKVKSSIEIWNGIHDNMIPFSKVMKWKDVTLSECHIKSFEGGHFFINDLLSDPSRFKKELV